MSKFVYIECLVDIVTERACHIKYHDENGKAKETWVPLSCVEAPDTVSKDDEELSVARWFAEREELPF